MSGAKSLGFQQVKPVAEMEHPRNVPELRRALGLFVQSMHFVPDYAATVKPLTRLTGKVPWKWGDVERAAFEKVRSAIVSRPKLWVPDPNLPLFIDTDASDVGWGAMIYQDAGCPRMAPGICGNFPHGKSPAI